MHVRISDSWPEEFSVFCTGKGWEVFEAQTYMNWGDETCGDTRVISITLLRKEPDPEQDQQAAVADSGRCPCGCAGVQCVGREGAPDTAPGIGNWRGAFTG